ncbi:BgTH12-03495 [Blumeria graminis f. sp. triticale]|uniref:Bgt-50474 n=2 Tax=Blumeria graminis TaxID=34373 RepID=A0A9X9L852_BLUGR|nr:BgTH12-03495 [Blumeria graminis f. sp. triticale]VCU39525.1 Bgt-50474 [Blumeria graminis f. sp. tritici]
MESMNSVSQAIHRLLKDNNLIHSQEFSDPILAQFTLLCLVMRNHQSSKTSDMTLILISLLATSQTRNLNHQQLSIRLRIT